MNQVNLIGHIGGPPDVRRLETGTVVAKISLATNETYKNKSGEKVQNTEWHKVIFWRGAAEVCEKHMHKGQRIAITGKIKTRSWEDASGVTHYTTEIHADSFEFLGSGRKDNDNSYFPPEEETPPNPPKANVSDGDAPIGADDDLPF